MKRRAVRKAVFFTFLAAFLPASGLPNPWAIEDLVGKGAPPFTLPDLTGKEVSLIDFKGKVVLLNFWATWCPPCRTEMPKLNDLKKSYEGRNFEVIVVATDRSLSPVKDFVAENRISLLVLHDSDVRVSRKYKVFSLPTSFLINRRGMVVERFLGEFDWNAEEMREKIDELL